MTQRFLKFIPSKEAFWLLDNKPNAFRLLTHIANRARRSNGNQDGLLIGQCHLQHWSKYKLTEREYRTAKEILVKKGYIKIISTNRKINKTTTSSTLVEIRNSLVYEINPKKCDDLNDDLKNKQNDDLFSEENPKKTTTSKTNKTTTETTTYRRQTRLYKNVFKESHHPPTPSFGLIDDFSFDKEKIEICKGVFLTQNEIDACVKIKGTVDKVKHAIEFIQNSEKRKHPILDWPNAISKWKIEDKSKTRIENHLAYAEKLCEEFPDYKSGGGWSCNRHHNKKNDERGIIFESASVYQSPFFVAFVDGEFQSKCENFITTKNMRKNNEI